MLLPVSHTVKNVFLVFNSVMVFFVETVKMAEKTGAQSACKSHTMSPRATAQDRPQPEIDNPRPHQGPTVEGLNQG